MTEISSRAEGSRVILADILESPTERKWAEGVLLKITRQRASGRLLALVSEILNLGDIAELIRFLDEHLVLEEKK